MSFLFKINGVQQQKASKIMSILNFIQAVCGFFQFIACIMIGNIKQQTKDHDSTITDSNLQKTYNPQLALYSIIGMLQVCFGVLVGMMMMGKLPFVQANKKRWLGVVHWGMLVQFGFICFICLESSTQSTIFAAINDTNISKFYTTDSSNAAYTYYESLVVYSRYLIAWAIMEFLLCLPISLANLYALHTRHINYEALMQEVEERTPPIMSVMQPETQYPNNRTDNATYNGYAPQGGLALEVPKPLEVQMIPKQ